MRCKLLLITAVSVALAAGGLVAAPPAQAATYPSWDDIQRAMGDETAKQTEIQRVQADLQRLQSEFDSAMATAKQTRDEFAAAQRRLEVQEEKTNALRLQALESEQRAKTLRAQAGRAVAQLARAGASQLDVALSSDVQDSDAVLYRLGAVSRISESNRQLADRATAETKTAQALAGQAESAQGEYARLTQDAQAKADAAAAAEQQVQDALAEQNANQATLTAQLSTLQGQTAALKDQRAAGIVQEQQERAAAAQRQAAALAAARTRAASGDVSAPVPAVGGGAVGYPLGIVQVTSRYGMRLHPVLGYKRYHYGVDFGAPLGASVLAVAAGTVTEAAGSTLTVRHLVGGQTVLTRYLHLSAILVRPGQAVGRGQTIGRVGNEGISTGPHLHFEVHLGSVSYGGGVYGTQPGNTVDPLAWLASH